MIRVLPHGMRPVVAGNRHILREETELHDLLPHTGKRTKKFVIQHMLRRF